jgi:hypothetical protein
MHPLHLWWRPPNRWLGSRTMDLARRRERLGVPSVYPRNRASAALHDLYAPPNRTAQEPNVPSDRSGPV